MEAGKVFIREGNKDLHKRKKIQIKEQSLLDIHFHKESLLIYFSFDIQKFMSSSIQKKSW